MSPRVLTLTASVGGGHVAASRTVGAALEAAGASVVERDWLDYLPAWRRAPALKLYHAVVRRWPGVWRAYYEATDAGRAPRLFDRAGQRPASAPLCADLRAVRPDLVVSTFTRAARAVEAARTPPVRHAVLVTDVRPHRHWAAAGADLFLVADDASRRDLAARGVDPRRVHVVGIPVRGAPAGATRAGVRARLGLDARPVLLVAGGAAGAWRGRAAVTDALDVPAHVLVVGGPRRDRPARRERGAVAVHDLGFRDDVPELLLAADLVVGKGGGLTVAEACATGVPLVVLQPIPGQEEGNASWLAAHGAGVWARSAAELREALSALLGDEPRRADMAAAARRLGRPNAARDAAALLLAAAGSAS